MKACAPQPVPETDRATDELREEESWFAERARDDGRDVGPWDHRRRWAS